MPSINVKHNFCTAKMDSCGTSLHVHVTQSFTGESFNKITNFGLLSENGLGETYAFQITGVIGELRSFGAYCGCDSLLYTCIFFRTHHELWLSECDSWKQYQNLFILFYFILYKIKILFLCLLHFISTYTCTMTIVPKVCDGEQYQNLKQQAVL